MAIVRESIIQNLYSTTLSATPDSNLQLGEIAINAADEAIFIKNSSGSIKKLSSTSDFTANYVTISTSQTVSGDKVFSGTVLFNNGIVFEGSTANEFETTLGVVDPTSDNSINLPNASGTVALVGGSDTHVQYNSSGALAGSSNLTFDGSNLKIALQGDIRLGASSSSNYIGIQAPTDVAASNIYTLPSSVGSAGQVLSISSAVGSDASLQWSSTVSSVNNLTGNVSLFAYQSTPPTSGISPGSRWMDSETGEEYVYVNDGSSNQWIQPSLNPLFGTVSGAVTSVTSSSYAATGSDYYIGVDYAGNVTITLPPSPQAGRMVVVKDESGEAGNAGRSITIVSDNVADLIDNDTSIILNINNGGINLIYRNGWRII